MKFLQVKVTICFSHFLFDDDSLSSAIVESMGASRVDNSVCRIRGSSGQNVHPCALRGHARSKPTPVVPESWLERLQPGRIRAVRVSN